MLRKEQCPDNLANMKQPSIIDSETKLRPYDEDDQKKFTDRPDRIDLSAEINDGLLPNYGLTSSSNMKHPWDHKKFFDKKDHHDYPSDRDRSKKKDHSGHPDGKNKPDKYFSNPFFLLGKTDDLDYLSELQLSLHTPQSLKGHRPKKPYQSETTERAGHSSPDKSNLRDFDKPGAGQVDETDNLDYSNESCFPQFILQPPHFTSAYRPTKHPKNPRLTKIDRLSLRPNKSDVYGSNKQPDGSSLYDSHENPFLTPNQFGGLPNSSKRPGRSPYSSSSYEFDSRGILDGSLESSDESSSKRVPRRGDIGIQSLDERGG